MLDGSLPLIAAVSLSVALLLQPLRRYADRRAQADYLERVGPDFADLAPVDSWLADRHVVGGWGCLVIALQALQGIAITMSIGAAVFWWLL